MDLDQVELTLLAACDEPERVCYEIQAKLLAIGENLRKHGVSAISLGAHPAGDAHMGQFIITLGPDAIEAIAALAGAWLQTRLGRRIRLKFDEVEVEVRTTHAIHASLKHVCAPASGFRASRSKRHGDRSKRSAPRSARAAYDEADTAGSPWRQFRGTLGVPHY